jgi:hypothetical protein
MQKKRSVCDTVVCFPAVGNTMTKLNIARFSTYAITKPVRRPVVTCMSTPASLILSFHNYEHRYSPTLGTSAPDNSTRTYGWVNICIHVYSTLPFGCQHTQCNNCNHIRDTYNITDITSCKGLWQETNIKTHRMKRRRKTRKIYLYDTKFQKFTVFPGQ